MITKTCLYCKETFQTWPSRVGRYCSYSCRAFAIPNPHWKKGVAVYIPPEARKRQGLKMKRFVGELATNWKGDNISKRHKHYRIQKIKGKPSVCEHCGKAAVDWANIDHKYSLKPEDYRALCRKCHVNYDFKMGFRVPRHKSVAVGGVV